MALRLALLLPLVGASRQTGGSSGLCTPQVVRENCQKFRKGENGKAMWVEVPQFARSMGISEVSALSFLDALGVQHHASLVSCRELCVKSVRRFPKESLPPRAQVACTSEEGKTSCDLDLSAAAMSVMGRKMDTAADLAAKLELVDDVVQLPATGAVSVASAVSAADDLAESVANWFEIFKVETMQTNLTTTQKQAISVAKATISKAMQYTSNANDVKAYAGSSATTTEAAKGMRSAQAVLNNFVWLATTKPGVGGFITCYGSVCCMRNGKNYINIHVNQTQLAMMTHILLHEALHCSPFNSKDKKYVYSDSAARDYAKSDPTNARNNTSSWTFYSQRALR